MHSKKCHKVKFYRRCIQKNATKADSITAYGQEAVQENPAGADSELVADFHA
jgi:hypothetical protein